MVATAPLDLAHIELLDIARRLGCEPRRAGSTSGGEWSASCPICGDGEDRLRLWPNHPDGRGRWWCRQCDKYGDAIDLVKAALSLDFPDACDWLGVDRPDLPHANGHHPVVARAILTVEMLAAHYGLEQKDLTRRGVADHPKGVAFSFKLPDSSLSGEKVRQFIEKPPGKDKRWIVTIPLSTPTLFGAESLSAMRQQSDTILVHESETDAIVDRVLGVPAVATGGKDWWNAAHWNLLMGFARVVAWREDDEGARLLAKMARTRPANGPVLLVAESPDETAKDPGRLLQRHGHEEAARLIREAIAGARPWETEAIPDSRTLQDADLDNTYPPVVPFPTDVLPEPARTLVVEGAASLGVPPDFIAVPFLAVTAGMIGNTQRIQLKRGFEQRAILWDATVGQPGSGKSPAQDLACAPMEELQREAKRIFDLQYQSQLTDWEHQPKEGRGQKPEPPRMDEYYVSDATWESIAPILEHVPGLPLRRDELVAWVGSYDAYRSGRGGDRQNWLSAWSGVPIKVNRRSGNGVPIYIPDPAISVLGGIQPDLLPALVKEAGRREGFIERFLWSWPEASGLEWSEEVLDPAIITEVKEVFRKLRSATPSVEPVRLAPDAKACFVAWHHENTVATQQVCGLAEGVYAKLPVQLARLCLTLHCLRYPGAPASVLVSADEMDDAIVLVEYFRAHAHRVLARFGNASTPRHAGLDVRIVRILRRDDSEWVNESDIFISLGRHVPMLDIRTTLAELQAADTVETRTGESGPKGGRSPVQWRTKPQEHKNPDDGWAEL